MCYKYYISSFVADCIVLANNNVMSVLVPIWLSLASCHVWWWAKLLLSMLGHGSTTHVNFWAARYSGVHSHSLGSERPLLSDKNPPGADWSIQKCLTSFTMHAPFYTPSDQTNALPFTRMHLSTTNAPFSIYRACPTRRQMYLIFMYYHVAKNFMWKMYWALPNQHIRMLLIPTFHSGVALL